MYFMLFLRFNYKSKGGQHFKRYIAAYWLAFRINFLLLVSWIQFFTESYLSKAGQSALMVMFFIGL